LFTFPNGHVRLKRIDQPFSGGEGIGSVRRAYRNRHARLRWRYDSQAMGNNTFYHRPPATGFDFEFGKAALGHFAIGFIAQSHSLTPAGEFAGRAKKQDNRAGIGMSRSVSYFGGVDRVID
jgi:hypothetical protein